VAVALVIVVSGLLVIVVKFLMAQWDKMQTRENVILDQAREERMAFQLIMNGFLATLKEHTVDASNRYEQTAEAHKYQREEHLKSIESLISICNTLTLMQEKSKNFQEYVVENLLIRKNQQTDIAKSLETMALVLKDVTAGLARLPGYK
jgi:hypothetical protein